MCLVTGGASGLGLATVKLLLEKGCRVVMADFNEVVDTYYSRNWAINSYWILGVLM